jgi:hypothetical protein
VVKGEKYSGNGALTGNVGYYPVPWIQKNPEKFQ